MKEEIEIGVIRHFKRKARKLHKMLRDYVPHLKLGHTFDYLASLYGRDDWHEMRVRLVKDNELVDNISCDLQNKADRLYSLVRTRSVHITVQDCYECLNCLYPTGNTDQEPTFESGMERRKEACNY